jgi:hypothetical protein
VPDLDATYSSFASAHGLEAAEALQAGPLTPLLVESKHCQVEPALRGTLPGGATGVVGHLAYKRNKAFRFNVALTELPGSTAFAPRVFCVRRGRSTRDDEFYGFEARHSKLWTESIALNERFAVSTSPFQDPNWLRQLFSPAFIDWLSNETPADFSFELCYGSLLGSVEEDHPDAGAIEALCLATSHVAERIRSECEESA